jgi:zinc-binding alcohol dehydrogenase/oxidoreductase
VVTDVRRLFWNQYTIMGSTMGNHAEYREIVRLLGQGELRPRIDSVVPLDGAIDAFRRMEAGEQMGKLVVRISSD